MPISGIEEVLSKLAQLPEKAMEGASHGMDIGLTRIRDGARVKAPHDTGALKEKISYKKDVGAGGVKGQVIVGVEYGVYVEFGTGSRGQASYTGDQAITYSQTPWWTRHGKIESGRMVFTKTKSKWFGQPAKPYLYPSFKENGDAAKGDIINGILESLGNV